MLKRFFWLLQEINKRRNMEINNHNPYSRCRVWRCDVTTSNSIQDGGALVVNILVFDLRVHLQHCTYQRKTLLFALIKVSTFICKREISGLSSPLNRSNVCWFSTSGYIHTHAQFHVILLYNLSDIPDFPKSHYAVWRMRWSYLHQTNPKYLEAEMRYARAVKTNLYNFLKVLSNKRVSFKPVFSFHIPFKLTNTYKQTSTVGYNRR